MLSLLQQASLVNALMITFSVFSTATHLPPSYSSFHSLANLVGTAVTMFFIESKGRIILLKIGNASILIVLIAGLALFKTMNPFPFYIFILEACLFMLYFGLSYGPIFWTMASELLFPMELTIPASVNYLLSFLISFIVESIDFNLEYLWIPAVVILSAVMY